MFGLDVLLLDIMFWEIPFVVSLNTLKYQRFYELLSPYNSCNQAFWCWGRQTVNYERTGHRSVAGVRSYKRITDNLNILTSWVLNEQVPPVKKLKSMK